MIGLYHYLIVAFIVFSIGLFGVLSRRNVITIMMSLELMANAVNISLLAFSAFLTPKLIIGQIFAIFVMVIAACEIGIGLAIVLSIYRNNKSINMNDINIMKW